MYRIEALNPNSSLIFSVPSYEIVIAETPSSHLRQTSYVRNGIRRVEFRKIISVLTNTAPVERTKRFVTSTYR